VRPYLAQPGFRWTCQGERTFRFCDPPGLESSQAAVRRDTWQSLAATLRLAGESNYTSEPLIYIFRLESVARLRKLLHVSAYGASEPKAHAVFFVSGHPEALAHELNHEILTTLWGPAEPWIAEGFAAYAAGLDVDSQCRALLASHGYLPLPNLVNPNWNASLYPSTKIYPELGSFVKYLRETRGLARLRKLWHLGYRSIAQVYGEPLSRLETEWRASLDRPSVAARP